MDISRVDAMYSPIHQVQFVTRENAVLPRCVPGRLELVLLVLGGLLGYLLASRADMVWW